MTERLFFVHIMKTGGTSFLHNLRAQFRPGEVYPDPHEDPDQYTAKIDVSYLLGLPEHRTRLIRAYNGHFPYSVVKRMTGRFVTMTVLRDPVDRTISYLKQCRELEEFRDQSLEQIYEDGWQFHLAIWNYQARIFALAPDDDPLSVMNAIEIDDRRLAFAKANLDEVDVLGLHERYDEFTRRVNERFGWPNVPPPQLRVSPTDDVPDSLRRRIADDNTADIEFYEYGRALVSRTR